MNYSIGRSARLMLTRNLFCYLFLLLGVANMSQAQDISETSPALFADVEITMTTPTVNVGQWKSFPVTVTVTNAGDLAAENLEIYINTCIGDLETATSELRLGGLVYASSTFQATETGTFNAVSATWKIPILNGGETATITLNYFTLTEEPIGLFAYLAQMSQPDIDSSPNPQGSQPCEVTEDDEAMLIINPKEAPFVCGEDVTLTTQAEVDAFYRTCFGDTGRPSIAAWEYDGAIRLEGSDINNLDSLGNLRFIAGGLSLINTSVENLGLVIQGGAVLGGVGFKAINNPKLKKITLGAVIGFKGEVIIQNNPQVELIVLPWESQRLQNVSISNNPTLTEVRHDGFRIEEVGTLTISQNPQLTAFPTSTIQTINGNAAINFSGIQSIDFSKLSTLKGQLTIGGNPQLTEIIGFDNLKKMGGGLTIAQNAKLLDLGGLENLERINEGGLTIVQSDALENINLASLQFIGGDVFFNQLSLIRDLRFLSKLTTITGQLTITENANFTKMDGLENLTTLNQNANPGGLVLLDNPKLTDCCLVEDLLAISTVQGNTDIRNNGLNCSSIEEIASNCTTLPCSGDITLTTQQEVDDFFNNCFDIPFGRSYVGSITLQGIDITNLDALEELRSIDGNFSIIGTLVEDLAGVLRMSASLGGNFVARNNRLLKKINLGDILSFNDSSSITIQGNSSLESIYLPYDS